ncbi:hypothetical protein QR77_36540 [Streptomyces sp. 150FB]|nr:hypothetical protein QR77_36540 [Streptomyces sp. 150FB]
MNGGHGRHQLAAGVPARSNPGSVSPVRSGADRSYPVRVTLPQSPVHTSRRLVDAGFSAWVTDAGSAR